MSLWATIQQNAVPIAATGTAGWLFSTFVSSLPTPGSKWTYYEIFYNFMTGVAANLPKRGGTMPSSITITNPGVTK